MRRIILAVCATAAGLVLLLSFKTNTQSAGTSSAAALGGQDPAAGAGAGASPATSGPASNSTGTSRTSASSTGKSGSATTVTGAAWPTIYGPVQVKITVSGGKITAVTAVEYPLNTPRDQQINAYAIPQLNSETMAAGSAKIDTVSGATYTSQGYIGSLQSAVDKAGIA